LAAAALNRDWNHGVWLRFYPRSCWLQLRIDLDGMRPRPKPLWLVLKIPIPFSPGWKALLTVT